MQTQTCTHTDTDLSSIWLASKKYLKIFLMYSFPLFSLYTYILLLKFTCLVLSEFVHAIFTLTQVCLYCVVPVHACMCICHPLQRYAPIKLCTLICRPTCEYDGPDQLMMCKHACNLTHQLLQIEQQMKVK